MGFCEFAQGFQTVSGKAFPTFPDIVSGHLPSLQEGKASIPRVIVPRGIRRQLGKNDVAVDDRLHGELLLPCRGLIKKFLLCRCSHAY